MGFSFKNFWSGLRLVPSTTDTTSEKGDLQARTDGKLYFNDGSSASSLITANGTDTLTNKTLTSPIINTPTTTGGTISAAAISGGTISGSTITGGSITGTTISGGALTPTSLAILDNAFTLKDDGDVTKLLQFDASNISPSTTRTMTAPDANIILVGTDNLQTITNKILLGAGSGVPDLAIATRDSDFELHDTFGDESSYIRFDANFGANNTSIKYGHTTSFTTGIVNSLTIADTSSTQTLTNKTINTSNNTIKSGSATVGQVLTADGAGNSSWANQGAPIAPTQQIFTTPGSGTYTPTASNIIYLKIRMVAGGGGGSGSGTTASVFDGGTGGVTQLTASGVSLVCNGGHGGQTVAELGGTGGTASFSGSGISGTAIQGGIGGGNAINNSSTSFSLTGGSGANSPFGGAGQGPGVSGTGNDAIANTGSGGGGASINNLMAGYSGCGGGAGGYIEAIVTGAALATLIASGGNYLVGVRGNHGQDLPSGSFGGYGGSGYLEITEYYQ